MVNRVETGDDARIRSAIDIAVARLRTDPRSAELTLEEYLQRLTTLFDSTPSLVTAARELNPSAWSRARHRRRYAMLKRVLSIERPVPPEYAQLDREALAAVLAVFRFGVPVNLTWYFRLENAVLSQDVTEHGMRRLLQSDELEVDEAGDLLLRRTSRIRRYWSWISGGMLLAAAALAHQRLASLGLLRDYWAPLFIADAALVVLLYAMWQAGPASWRSSRILEELDFFASSEPGSGGEGHG